MANCFVLIFIILLHSSCTFEKKTQKCDDNITETANGTAYWKFRGVRYTTSEDFLCWQDNWEILLRECDTTSGEWQPKNVECKKEETRNLHCPEDLLEINTENGDPLCLKVSTQPQKYDESYCHGANIISPHEFSEEQTLSFIKFLEEKNISEYWLPIQRESRYVPFKIRLPGTEWGKVIDDRKITLKQRSDQNCISAVLSYHGRMGRDKKLKSESFLLKTTACEELLHAICISDDNLTMKSGCAEGEWALNYRPDKCYGLDNQDMKSSQRNQIHLSQYFQKRNIFRFLLKALARDEKYDFVQFDQFTDDLKSEYFIVMNRKEEVRVVTREKNEGLPILYSYDLHKQQENVQLFLKFDASLQELILIIYNGKYLWRVEDDESGVNCFTNADYELERSSKLDLVWTNKNETKSIYKLKLVGDGPGEYWCEGHTVFDFSFVSTQRVVAAKKTRGHSFAVNLNVSCLIANDNICNNLNRNAKRLAKHLLEVLRRKKKESSSDLVIHGARVMSVENIQFLRMECWVHLTASLKLSAVDNSEEESSEENNSSEDENQLRHDTAIRMKVWNLLRETVSTYSPHNSNLIRSTQYCFPVRVRLDDGEYQWQQAVSGQMGLLSKLCLQSNGMPYTRKCIGNFLRGAYWEPLDERLHCFGDTRNMKITKDLYSLSSSARLKHKPDKVVTEVRNILQENARKVLPIDIYFTADIVQTSMRNLGGSNRAGLTNGTASEQVQPKVLKEAIVNLIYIYNSLVSVKESTLQMSATLNSTNKLLDTFENALSNFPAQSMLFGPGKFGDSSEVDSKSDFEVLDYDDIGVSVRISPHLLYFIINTAVANISGVALFENGNTTEANSSLKGAFINEHYRFLQSSHAIEDFIYEPALLFATYCPESLLLHMDSLSNLSYANERADTIVVIKVYSNDKLFQTPTEPTQSAFGRVVSISLPGHSSHLPEELPIVFRASQNKSLYKNDTPNMCSYWNFENWATDGIHMENMSEFNDQIVICKVSHLTPFAYLVGYKSEAKDSDDLYVSPQHDHGQALDVITVIGCTLSLLGISGIFITAAMFSSWRQKASSKVLLHLSGAIALQMIVLCFISTEEFSLHLILNEIVFTCVAIGALLHYSILVQFFWMIFIAYLQFQRYVRIIGGARPNRFLIKATIFCWGVPLLPVLLTIVLDNDSFSKGPICYPSGYALYFGLIMPITIIIAANFVIFCLILYNIYVSSSLPIRHSEKPILMYQIRLSVLLFFLLGFTWCFGILSSMKAGIMFSYLFSLTATLQGFVIFLYFIVLDPITRRMWAKYFCELCSNDKNFLSSTASDKDTDQTN